MRNKHGEFIWYELLTPDTAGAQAFYSQVLNWQFADTEAGGQQYSIINVADADRSEPVSVGGMLTLSEEMKQGGAHPVWLGYIGVDDVDDCVRRATEAGGKVLMPAWDVEGVGRLAMITDPQGAPFYVMRGAADETSSAFAADKPRPGHCAWNELANPDPADAWRFYGSLFHWQKDGEMDMGAMGKYEFIRHGVMIGAIMPKPEQMPVPMWTYYFRVAGINAALRAVSENGGQVLFGPGEVPGGDRVANCMDPQGAMFSLVGQQDD